ncbi:unnamed protein product [Moneuplotes crassus]|uniref:Uncharacterized protein n=1 Tax=Euplotes crassus TaxID=5936 RepID=A0AAD1UM38_EUPCR|nr:unnamed protein product [Moneuplotes crassus]
MITSTSPYAKLRGMPIGKFTQLKAMFSPILFFKTGLIQTCKRWVSYNPFISSTMS